MYSHAFAHSHTNIVHVCLTFLSLPDYLNSHCFAKQRTIKLYPFLNHPFLHRVPTPGSTPPLKEFEREALICWVRFSTAHTFLSLSFLFLSFSGSLQTLAQSQTWSAGGPPAGAGAACLLSSDYTFASCFPKSPECRHGAASCRRTSRCRGTHKNQLWGQPDPSFPVTCRAAVGTETVPACGRGSVWPAQPCHRSLKGGLSGHGLADVLRGLYGARAATYFLFFLVQSKP